jgi:hypothetical protein
MKERCHQKPYKLHDEALRAHGHLGGASDYKIAVRPGAGPTEQTPSFIRTKHRR